MFVHRLRGCFGSLKVYNFSIQHCAQQARILKEDLFDSN